MKLLLQTIMTCFLQGIRNGDKAAALLWSRHEKTLKETRQCNKKVSYSFKNTV